jgi:hypothetical protein
VLKITCGFHDKINENIFMLVQNLCLSKQDRVKVVISLAEL